jgi:hypothetical protein
VDYLPAERALAGLELLRRIGVSTKYNIYIVYKTIYMLKM